MNRSVSEIVEMINTRTIEILVGLFVAAGMAALFMLAMQVSNLGDLPLISPAARQPCRLSALPLISLPTYRPIYL